MNLDEPEIRGVDLMEGEEIDSALRPLGHVRSDDQSRVMLLTNKRLIHLQGDFKARKAAFISIEDIDAVEMTLEREEGNAFVWAGLAFIVAILMYVVIDQPFMRILAPISVGLMGLYLILDHILSSSKPVVVFRAGMLQLHWDAINAHSANDIYPFINRLFLLKERLLRSGNTSRPGRLFPH